MINESLFPKHPNETGTIVAVYVTPVIGSEEKICIAGVCVINGVFEVSRAFSHHEIRSLFKLNGLIDESLKQIKQHLQKGLPIDEWRPAMPGVTLGNLIQGSFGCHGRGLRTLFRSCSMFYVNRNDS